MIRTFLSGLLVGAADIVPGISGGTVAFIIGIYEELLASIASFSFSLLFRGEIRQFIKQARWKFLSLFVLGLACSIITLAKVFQYFLHEPTLRPLLYSAFMGLVVGSSIFCARLLSGYKVNTFLYMAAGALCAYLLTGTDLTPAGGTGYDVNALWVVVCGVMAISAMLLPGISGSYILNIVGMYGPILAALVAFVDGLRAGYWDWPAFKVVASMVFGVALGALFFARVVRYLLATYREATLAVLVGFMVGALRAVWPFWSYCYDADLHRIQVIDPILPEFASISFILSCLFFAAGIASVFFVEKLARRTQPA